MKVSGCRCVCVKVGGYRYVCVKVDKGACVKVGGCLCKAHSLHGGCSSECRASAARGTNREFDRQTSHCTSGTCTLIVFCRVPSLSGPSFQFPYSSSSLQTSQDWSCGNLNSSLSVRYTYNS